MNHHIVSCATGYTAEQLRPFILSALANTDAKIWLLRTPGDCMPFDGNMERIRIYEIDAMECPVVQRFGHIGDMIADCIHDNDHVIHCDCRDLVFLGDPFQLVERTRFVATREAGQMAGADKANASWVCKLLSLAGMMTADDWPICCAGCFAGRADRVAGHCRAIAELCRGQHWFGADQAAHNLLVRTGELDQTAWLAHHAVLGGVMTKAKPILHQYDRHPEMVAMVAGKVAEWSKTVGQL